uniref:Uncharacterized protein n=1 Tax=Encephalitozoon cuniculi TaxID=6035 RepID=M1JJJ0_ENCCN|nr:hypothetical protein ECU02_0180 [Encephalitozoon cuniculi]
MRIYLSCLLPAIIPEMYGKSPLHQKSDLLQRKDVENAVSRLSNLVSSKSSSLLDRESGSFLFSRRKKRKEEGSRSESSEDSEESEGDSKPESSEDSEKEKSNENDSEDGEEDENSSNEEEEDSSSSKGGSGPEDIAKEALEKIKDTPQGKAMKTLRNIFPFG